MPISTPERIRIGRGPSAQKGNRKGKVPATCRGYDFMICWLRQDLQDPIEIDGACTQFCTLVFGHMARGAKTKVSKSGIVHLPALTENRE